MSTTLVPGATFPDFDPLVREVKAEWLALQT